MNREFKSLRVHLFIFLKTEIYISFDYLFSMVKTTDAEMQKVYGSPVVRNFLNTFHTTLNSLFELYCKKRGWEDIGFGSGEFRTNK